MNGLNPQIPMSVVQQQPSFAQQMGQTYQLAGAIEKQREQQTMRQDQQALQNYLKEGGNLDTPDGLVKASEWAKQNLSFGGYQTVVQAGQEAKLNEAKKISALAQADLAKIDLASKKSDILVRSAKPVLDQYEEDKNKYSEQQATEIFKNNWQKQIQTVALSGIFQPQELQDASVWTPGQTKSRVESSEYFQKLNMQALKLRKEQADIELAQARKKALERGGVGAIPDEISKSTLHGQEFLSLLSPGEAADTLAVAEGRKSLADIPARGGQRGRIGQFVTQFDPGFSNVRNPADKAAAVAISKDLSAIRPYGEMLDKNADIAVDLAKKAIATDSRLANKSINWLKQNMTDNPDVAEFLAQTTFVQTEAARVLNNPRLVGQLTDTARQEMEHVISGDMPIKSYERVIRRIQQDGRNRIQAMENQRDRILMGTGRQKEVPQSELAKTGESAAVPRGADDIMSILKKHGVK